MSQSQASLADALLRAHVAFVLGQLGGDGLQAWIEDLLDALLADAAKIKLKDAVTPRMIKDTARTFAVEVQFAGGLPELVGDIARELHAHPIHRTTTFGDLLPDRRFEEILDKALEFRGLRENLLRQLSTSPVYAEWVSQLLLHGIQDYLADNPLTRNIPGAGSMVKLGRRMISRASSVIDGSIEDSLKQTIGRSVEASVQRSVQNSLEFMLDHLDDAALREVALDTWERLRTQKVSALLDEIDSRDSEELFVIGYEYFQQLRRTAFFGTVIDAGIDAFFHKYGKASLRELLDDIGISRDMMLTEALRFAPPVIRMLQRKKLLEPLLRRYLEPFYRSDAFAKAIAATAGP